MNTIKADYLNVEGLFNRAKDDLNEVVKNAENKIKAEIESKTKCKIFSERQGLGVFSIVFWYEEDGQRRNAFIFYSIKDKKFAGTRANDEQGRVSSSFYSDKGKKFDSEKYNMFCSCVQGITDKLNGKE